MYEVNYSGQTSYVSSYFYCIRPEGLLAIAKFLVVAAVDEWCREATGKLEI